MKTKILKRNIKAYHTNDPGEILRLITAAEAITLPDMLYNLGADVIATVKANVPEREANDTAAVYLLRVAYILNQEGRLIEAPQKPPKKKSGGMKI